MQRVQVYGTKCSQTQCSMALSSMPRNQDERLISPHATKWYHSGGGGEKMRAFGCPCTRVLYPNSRAKAAEWISRSRETWALIGVQRHYFVSAPLSQSTTLLKEMGIVANSERKQKGRVLWQESQQAQHVFGQIEYGANKNRQVHGGAALNSRARVCVWPTIECKCLSLLRRGTTSCVRLNESRLIGGRAMRAPTIERATFNVKSKPNGSRTMRA
jgi:hypothetical protein